MKLGDKVADAVAAIIGSWRFIGLQTATIMFWVFLNTRGNVRPDPFPFVFLNLLLSFQAAYTGPVLLMSANRQAAIDRKRAIENFELDKLDHEDMRHVIVKLKEIEEDLERAVQLKCDLEQVRSREIVEPPETLLRKACNKR